MNQGLSTEEAEKLAELSKSVYSNAYRHGWHKQYQSAEHWLGLIMSEVGEAIDADRKSKRAKLDSFMAKAPNLFPKDKDDAKWKKAFENYIKDTVEDELSDVVIRLLDMAYAIYGMFMDWKAADSLYDESKSFSDSAWCFVKDTLNWSQEQICKSIAYVLDWAESLGISLELHIKLKMAYNESRPYMHGGKKY